MEDERIVLQVQFGAETSRKTLDTRELKRGGDSARPCDAAWMMHDARGNQRQAGDAKLVIEMHTRDDTVSRIRARPVEEEVTDRGNARSPEPRAGGAR
jgi:hypothetical protein